MVKRNLPLLLVLAALGLLLVAVAHRAMQQEPFDQWGAQVSGGAMSDVPLYRSVAIEVARGKPYYATVVAIHRERGFPLRPFYTVRLPAMAHLTALLGVPGLIGGAVVLLIFGGYHWYLRDPDAGMLEKALVAGIFAQGGVSFIAPQTIFLHEAWAGMLLSAALALLMRDRWWTALAMASLALAIREFAALFVAWMALFALMAGERKRVAAAGGVLASFLVYFLWHRLQVQSLTVLGDLASPGWIGMRGPSGVVADYAILKDIAWLPGWLSGLLIVIAFAGWIAFALRNKMVPRTRFVRLAWFPFAWFASFLLFAAIFARADNFYWLAVTSPAFLLGLAFAPGVLPYLRGDSRKQLTNPQ